MSDDSVFASLQQVAGVRYNRAQHNRDIIDTYLLRKAREKGVRLPTGTAPEEYKYLGAHVEDSTAGVNRHVNYVDVGCFTRDHEVITPEGVKRIDEFEVGDPVYTLDPETFEVIEDEVAEVHEYPNIYGEVHTSDSLTHDFAVTENHHFYTANNPQKTNDELRPEDYEWNEYRDIPDSRSVLPNARGVVGEEDSTFPLVDDVDGGYVTIYYDCDLRSLRGAYSQELRERMETTSNGWSERRNEERPSKHRVPVQVYREHREEIQEYADECYLKPSKQSRETPLEYDMGDWLELVAWYVSEGSSTDSNPNRVTIAQEQQNHHQYIVDLCERMGVSYSTTDNHIYLYGAVVPWLEEHCGVGSANKRLPDVALTQPVQLSQTVLQTLVDGDGSDRHPNSRYYWTVSEQLVDDILELSLRAGETPRVTQRRGNEYRVQWGTDGSFNKRDNGTVRHDGRVYCITGAENHLIPVGRNGNFHWIGQSMYPSLIMSLNASPETLVGTAEDLEASEYTEEDCVWGYVDPRPVKHLDGSESGWRQFTDGTYKMVYDPEQNDIKWTCDERDGPQYTKLYFLDHETQKGFLTECVEELIDLKNQYRGTSLYGSTKRVTNSVYGVLGFATEDSAFRLFNWQIAEAITLCGRKMIQYSRDYVLEKLHERGYEDAYAALGDTDGVGIAIPSAGTRDEAMRVVSEAVESLNGAGYDDLFQSEFGVPPEHHHGEIEMESYAPKVFVPMDDDHPDYPHTDVGVKKRRIEWLTWDEDEGETDDISITGLEAVRSDVAPVTVDAQQRFAETLRMDRGPAREDLFPYLRDVAESVRTGEVDLDCVCKRKGIGQPLHEYGSTSRRPSPIYRGAKYANEHLPNVTIQHGDKPRLVYVKDVRGEYPSVYDAVTAEDGDAVDAVAVPDGAMLPEAFVVDWERHFQTVLKEPLRPLLDTRFGGDGWSQCLYQHEQRGLDAFEAVGD